jgi:hypothetical protein
MHNVGKSEGEKTFAREAGYDEDAPIPALRDRDETA